MALALVQGQVAACSGGSGKAEGSAQALPMANGIGANAIGKLRGLGLPLPPGILAWPEYSISLVPPPRRWARFGSEPHGTPCLDTQDAQNSLKMLTVLNFLR